MAKVKYIRCDIYKRGINIFIGTPEQLIDWAEKTYNEDVEDEEFIKDLKTGSFGLADFHWGNGYGVVRLPKFPKTPEEIAYTVHELFHATSYLLGYSGVSYSNESLANEAYAYLIEHLTRNIFDKEGYEEVK